MPELTETERRELIRELAEKVMGWTLRPERPTQVSEHQYYEWSVGELVIWPHWGSHGKRWDPTESWSDAGMIVEWMRELGFRYSIGSAFGDGWDGKSPHTATFVKPNDAYRPRWITGGDSDPVDISTDQRFFKGQAESTTIPLAISLAARAALGGKQ